MSLQNIPLRRRTDLRECSQAAFNIAAYTLLPFGYKAVTSLWDLSVFSATSCGCCLPGGGWRSAISSPPFFLPARSSAFPSRVGACEARWTRALADRHCRTGRTPAIRAPVVTPSCLAAAMSWPANGGDVQKNRGRHTATSGAREFRKMGQTRGGFRNRLNDLIGTSAGRGWCRWVVANYATDGQRGRSKENVISAELAEEAAGKYYFGQLWSFFGLESRIFSSDLSTPRCTKSRMPLEWT
jgi:hypothetical protein